MFTVVSLLVVMITSCSSEFPEAEFDSPEYISNVIHDNRFMAREPIDEDDEYRRHMTQEEQSGKIIYDDDGAQGSGRRYSDTDFAYHDKMDSNEGGTAQEFEENLRHFMNKDNLKSYSRRMSDIEEYLHGRRRARRSVDSTDESEPLSELNAS
ncbi:uncharacterized protein LOC142982925 isoform X2 [Anticarsia gemmatalis]|uniref:uncharacterized protein LOC142982925 isoform X2 n=1 Tax=Anticarsia gemmatalis TaxID=129554 RepID=UPI003F75D9B6